MISESDFRAGNSNNFALNGDEDEVMAVDVVNELFRVWRNERGTFELQNNPEELIREVLELIDFQSNNKLISDSTAFIDCLYQMDMERIKFVVKSLLRCRMSKIERSWTEFWPNWSPEERAALLQSRMTSFEREYLQGLAGNVVAALTESVLEKLPGKLATLDDEEMAWSGPRPVALSSLDNHVICRVKRDLGEVVLDPISRATSNLQANDTFVLQYAVIKDFLESGDIELV